MKPKSTCLSLQAQEIGKTSCPCQPAKTAQDEVWKGPRDRYGCLDAGLGKSTGFPHNNGRSWFQRLGVGKLSQNSQSYSCSSHACFLSSRSPQASFLRSFWLLYRLLLVNDITVVDFPLRPCSERSWFFKTNLCSSIRTLASCPRSHLL